MSRSKRTKRKRVSKKQPKKNSSPKKQAENVQPVCFRIYHDELGAVPIQSDEIICMNAYGNYTWVHTTKYPDRVMHARHNLKHCLLRLPPEKFFRSHDEWAIHLGHIKLFAKDNKYVVMKNDHRPLISDSHRAEFKRLTGDL